MCMSVCIFVSFTVFYCTTCIDVFSFFYLYCLSVCLYVSCLCLWALLPDLNKMMMMIIIKFYIDNDTDTDTNLNSISKQKNTQLINMNRYYEHSAADHQPRNVW